MSADGLLSGKHTDPDDEFSILETTLDLNQCFNLIIGVELIRMMYYHTADSVFEVLLFAIARQIIIDHSSIWVTFIGVCSIAVLYATRKFLFCHFHISDEADENSDTSTDVLKD